MMLVEQVKGDGSGSSDGWVVKRVKRVMGGVRVEVIKSPF